MFFDGMPVIKLQPHTGIDEVGEIREAAGNIYRTLDIEKAKHPERADEIEFLQKRLPVN